MLGGEGGRSLENSAMVQPWDARPCGVSLYQASEGKEQVLRLSQRCGCRAHRSFPLVILLDSMLSGLETVPLQSRPTSKMNLDEHFVSAEECLRIFPKKLKDSFRVTWFSTS